MKQTYWSATRFIVDWIRYPGVAVAERTYEKAASSGTDHGSDRVLAEVIDWLCRAQDWSATADGGVARDYGLIHGWASSYPETTGYIIPTLVAYAQRSGQSQLLARAKQMADWLVSIQLHDGAFQGGKIDSHPVVPVAFNTGQVLLGLSRAHGCLGDYREASRRAADWLVRAQDTDGCWRRYPSPFVRSGDKVYDTHVAWALLEADRLEPARGYAGAAHANVRWALTFQRPNGWLDHCCLDWASEPLTHTIGYALRGVIEAFRATGDRSLLDASRLTADGVISAMRVDGYLPGRLRSDWTPSVNWACLTGSAQIACCWLLLFDATGDQRYAEAAFRANAFVRRTVRVEGAPEVRGAVKGSYPVSGAYGRYQYLSWAAKFLADSLMLELDVRKSIG